MKSFNKTVRKEIYIGMIFFHIALHIFLINVDVESGIQLECSIRLLMYSSNLETPNFQLYVGI